MEGEYSQKASQVVDFLVESNKLKRTKRYSPCPEGMHEPTAGHSWHLALMVPIIAKEFMIDIDVLHAVELAVVHDLPEYVLEEDFDSYLVDSEVLSRSDKEKSENEVMSGLKDRFDFGKSLYSLWKEYSEGKTPEARFVRALDKLESHMHIIQRSIPFSSANEAKHQALYADEAVKNFKELNPLLKETKKRLKPILEKSGLTWKDEYDYPDKKQTL